MSEETHTPEAEAAPQAEYIMTPAETGANSATPESKEHIEPKIPTDAELPVEEPHQEPALNTDAKESIDDVVEISSDVSGIPEADVAQVDANLQQSMMQPEDEARSAHEVIQEDEKATAQVDASKKPTGHSGSLVFIGVAVAIAVMLGVLGFLAIAASGSTSNEPTVSEQAEPEANPEPVPTTVDIDEAFVNEEVQAIQGFIEDIESATEPSISTISDESLSIE